MDFLLDPNIAYLILLGGIVLGFLAIVTPGTGLLELGALFCVVLAGYAIYNLSINWWALILLLLSVIPFLYAVQRPKRELFLGISIFLLVVGSSFLFAVDGWMPAVNPIVALLSSGSVAAFLWVVVRKSIQAANVRPTHDLEALVGQMGEARTDIHDDGSVYIHGELWSAKSGSAIPVGSHVRVVRREGFVLVVESTNQSNT
jgi:membrane-bound serine protease (ClpP class)